MSFGYHGPQETSFTLPFIGSVVQLHTFLHTHFVLHFLIVGFSSSSMCAHNTKVLDVWIVTLQAKFFLLFYYLSKRVPSCSSACKASIFDIMHHDSVAFSWKTGWKHCIVFLMLESALGTKCEVLWWAKQLLLFWVYTVHIYNKKMYNINIIVCFAHVCTNTIHPKHLKLCSRCSL